MKELDFRSFFLVLLQSLRLIIAVAVAMAVIFGVALAVAAKVFEVKEDPRLSVILENLEASLYGTDKTQTDVKAGDVTYNFATKLARTSGNARVEDPRFTARGKGVVFSTATNKGFLHGPVTTTVSAKLFNEKKDDKK